MFVYGTLELALLTAIYLTLGAAAAIWSGVRSRQRIFPGSVNYTRQNLVAPRRLSRGLLNAVLLIRHPKVLLKPKENKRET